jgi:hypothetical protein
MKKAKIITLRFIVFFISFAGFILALEYFLTQRDFAVVHDAGAFVRVWHDLNADGIRDNNEPPLSNVCVWGGYASSYRLFRSWSDICKNQYFMTDSNGEWSEFFAGGRCSEIYILVNPPAGYRPTTPLTVNSCSAEFGFVPSDVTEIQQLDWKQYLQELNEKEILVSRLKLGIEMVMSSVFAVFVSMKIIRPVKAKPG